MEAMITSSLITDAELFSCWHGGLVQGSGACLDQLASTPSVCWHKTSYDYDFVDDDLQVRLLNKLVQLCYVSIEYSVDRLTVAIIIEVLKVI